MVTELPMTDLPFSPQTAAISIKIAAKKVDWNLENQSSTPVPQMNWVSQEEEIINMIPYGCTNLRLTEFPIVK